MDYPSDKGMTLRDMPGGMTHIFDIVRPINVKGSGMTLQTIAKAARGTIYFSRTIKREGISVGGVDEDNWMCTLRVYDGQYPRDGDQLVDIRLARTGVVVFNRLFVYFVETLGSQFDFNLWCHEASQ